MHVINAFWHLMIYLVHTKHKFLIHLISTASVSSMSFLSYLRIQIKDSYMHKNTFDHCSLLDGQGVGSSFDNTNIVVKPVYFIKNVWLHADLCKIFNNEVDIHLSDPVFLILDQEPRLLSSSVSLFSALVSLSWNLLLLLTQKKISYGIKYDIILEGHKMHFALNKQFY